MSVDFVLFSNMSVKIKGGNNMKNTLGDLNNHLFMQLERLTAKTDRKIKNIF